MVLNALREHLLAAIDKSPAGLVFAGEGRVAGCDNHSTLNKVLAAAQVKAGVVDAAGKPKYSVHDLRHFYASWLIAEGFPPKRIQALMGHATIGMTLDVYGHLFELGEADHDRLAAAELALVGGKS